MSPFLSKPVAAIAAVAVLAAVAPPAALAHGNCKPIKAAHRVVYKPKPKPVRAVRVVAAAPCACLTRTVVRYVPPPPPPVRRVIVYREHPEPAFRHAPYVDESPVVYRRYAVDRTYVRHDYARRDSDYDRRWRHYDWRDDSRRDGYFPY